MLVSFTITKILTIKCHRKNDEANLLNYFFKYILIIPSYKIMWGKSENIWILVVA